MSPQIENAISYQSSFMDISKKRFAAISRITLTAKVIIPLLYLLTTVLSAHAEEKILTFHSDITIHEDATMTVCETIHVACEGKEIKHGIYRDFPTQYTGTFGTDYTVGFNLISVTRDGAPEDYHTESLFNGIRIYIGKKDVFIPPGEHLFTITYKTERQLGFFKDHDELYWNVTGNSWIFPIEKATAAIALPPKIPASSLTLNGYTGMFGSQESDYQSQVDDSGNVYFAATRQLNPFEGLTIVVSWPKGYVNPPNIRKQLWYFVWDAKTAVIGIMGIFFLVLYYAVVWRLVGKDPQKGVIMPLYTPPEGLSPAAMRYILKMGYSDKAFAAAVINLAVKGYLQIQKDTEYTIRKTPEADFTWRLPGEESELCNALPNNLILKQYNHKAVYRVVEVFKDSLKKYFARRYFMINAKYRIPGIIISMATLAGELLTLITNGSNTLFPMVVFIVSNILLLGTNIFFGIILKAPTILGRKVMDQIEGFKMYLSAVEGDRLNRMYPPEQLPVIFERYLPYALALDLEQQWAEQFSAVLGKMAVTDAGGVSSERSFRWYTGSSRDLTGLTSFTSSFSKSFTYAISSSSYAPGSSSGSRSSSGSSSGGRSGGGGGGGGGGGW